MIRFACRLTRPEFSFDVAFEGGGGVTALFGPSGSGKSTVIRLLAGLARADAGSISVGGTVLLDTATGVFARPHRRRIGVVFQDARLFPHLSVRSNLLYGRWFTPAGQRRLELAPVVEVLGIGHLLARRPDTLSGGERQRVAIGRALLASPRLLLMDEPLASLDAGRKLEILPFIERLRDEFAIPVVYVSHAVDEVARLAAHVVRLERGRVAAAGPPADVLAAASLGETADRFEAVSILSAPVRLYRPEYGVTILAHPAGDIIVSGEVAAGRTARVTIRATNVALARVRPDAISTRTALAGRISRLETDDGPFALVTLALAGGDMLRASVTRLSVDALGLAVGDEVTALVRAAGIDERGLSSTGPTADAGRGG
jgi:molybdate transport system ATP-binding protein